MSLSATWRMRARICSCESCGAAELCKGLAPSWLCPRACQETTIRKMSETAVSFIKQDDWELLRGCTRAGSKMVFEDPLLLGLRLESNNDKTDRIAGRIQKSVLPPLGNPYRIAR